MPFLVFFVYIILETLAFWAVSRWIGLGWALLALFVCMFFGMSIAGFEVRRLMSHQVVKGEDGVYYMDSSQAGKTAGNVGLTLLGGFLLSMPGFVSTGLGILLILPPTRAFIRTIAAASLYRKIENVGARMYEASPMHNNHASYGSFGTPPSAAAGSSHPSMGGIGSGTEVIEEEEIHRWSEQVSPEDFSSPGGTEGTKRTDHPDDSEGPSDSPRGGK
ncbi:FxsA family protein [Corynebacterium flavescens]|uniref:FxsA family protein n=1 Tax=Corynebacterium flavescens TaxID=28028 RepID=UPI002647C319|nr:FxsA family protein [Corynebacterium flavescens]MDN6430456.1 FxsA family protein [Corynebacterium flavescens]MDN6474403.1 FxsA family protein [Corynebacterium flavescens]MDN6552558.1 FxsA family protein [Corynebacterium flavescens]MDN6601438.1 FxsA family protein [Corynebacterium flavescens]MDN6645180.1 FxsA family protein [Corynebacterium flavescens]